MQMCKAYTYLNPEVLNIFITTKHPVGLRRDVFYGIRLFGIRIEDYQK